LHVENSPEKKHSKSVIIVAGPTAVGKTALAIDLARYFKTEIISADSRQCFSELNIGVARPSIEELDAVPHHFIASHSIHDKVDAAIFEKYALKKINDLFREHDVVLMAGGTGLYIKTFCEGMDDIPDVKPEIRNDIMEQYEENGLGWLQQKIKERDPEFYKVGEMQNPQRLMRALEIIESTGQSVLHFRKGDKIKRDFNILKIGMELPKEELQRNIHTRTGKMIEAGLIDEVKNLLPYKNFNALKTVGYAEIIDYLGKKISLEKAIELINTHTRQYAKRQMTWFRKDKEIQWFDRAKIREIIELILERL
jgi:tRNA dimethylallyltransferase